VVRAAGRRPDVLFIGLDADPTQMRRASAHAPANARFVVAAAEALPSELAASVAAVTIFFPWASLLRGLVGPSAAVLSGIGRVLTPGGTLTVLLSITGRDGGKTLARGSIDCAAYRRAGLQVTAWRPATPGEIEASDSSWAKRLRAGADRAVWYLEARSPRKSGGFDVALPPERNAGGPPFGGPPSNV